MSRARALAVLLVRHARRTLPQNRAAWAGAMEAETGHIAGDREALNWALGCVVAAYAARIRAEDFLLPRAVRLLLAAWCLSMSLLFIYRAALFSMCPFFANPECQATLNPVPFVLHSIANGLYLLTALYLVRNRRAFRTYAAGFLLIMAGEIYTEMLPDRGAIFFTLGVVYDFYTSNLGTFRMPGGYANLEIVLTVLVLPMMLGLAIWMMDRCPDGAETAPAKD